MNLPATFVRTCSLLLLCLLVLSSVPPAALAAVLEPPDGALLGSVSAAGPVELRGVAISREGTLFSGDTVRTRGNAYASIALSGGQRIELGDETGLRFEADGSSVRVAMTSGTVALSSVGAESPVRILVGDGGYEILAVPGAVADIAYLGGGELGVRTTAGALTLRAPGEEPVVIDAGSSRILPVGGAPGPEPPRRQGSRGQWATIGIVGASALIGYILWAVLSGDEASPSTP